MIGEENIFFCGGKENKGGYFWRTKSFYLRVSKQECPVEQNFSQRVSLLFRLPIHFTNDSHSQAYTTRYTGKSMGAGAEVV